MIACYALAKKFGAVISYEGNEPDNSLDILLTDTQGVVKEAKK
jgi:hypothetical protein